MSSDTESEEYEREEQQPIPRNKSKKKEQYPTPNPPPRYAWLRPCMQNYAGRINHYIRIAILKDVKTCLQRYGRFEEFVCGPFGHLHDLRREESANAALHQLLARELYDPEFGAWEKWFHVCGHDIRFGTVEFCLVTGLHFGPSPQGFDPNADHDIPSTSFFHRVLRGKKTYVSDLQKRFNSNRLGDNPDDYLKAANILVAYFIIFCRDQDYVDNWVWALIEDSQAWLDFPWGSYSFQILCHGMSVLKKHPSEIRGSRKTYHFYGPTWALQIWSYEAIPSLGRACGLRDTALRLPRCLMWTTWKSSADFTHFFDQERECYPRLAPTELETEQLYYNTLLIGQTLDVRFHPGGRYAGLREPVLPAPPSPIIPRRMARSSSRTEKARGKMPEVVERQRRSFGAPTGSPSKRRRPQEFEPGPDAEPDHVCCEHASWGRRDEELISRVTQSVTREVTDSVRRTLVEDESEHGLIARVTRRVVAAMHDFFGRRSRRSRKSSSSHVGRGSEECEGPRISHRRSTSHIVEERPRGSHRRSSHHDDRPLASQRRSSHHDDRPLASQRRSSHHDDQARGSQRQSASHHSERQPSLRRSASHRAETSARQPSPVTPNPGERDDDVQFSWTTDEEEAEVAGRPRRTIKPSALLQSPYVTDGPLDTPKAKKVAFCRFRQMGDDACVPVLETGYMMTQAFFGRILDRRAEFDAEIIDLWILKQNRRIRVNQEYIGDRGRSMLQPGISRHRTSLASTNFYNTLYREYGMLHPEDPHGNNIQAQNAYTHWDVPDSLITMFQGTDADHTWPWLEASEVSLVILKGRVTQRRQASMRCICRLMPRLLHAVGYWENNRHKFVHAASSEMAYVMMPINQQFVQQDVISCGVYACAYLDRLICGTPKHSHLKTIRDVEKYRYIIACRIWELCTPIPSAL
ncbi:uncharacterized protein LOC131009955 [Salvia miltiorrhiza]|uniref:uncharacterized protein LOC131009955 n=1 Tax=Salvia miltiorrhiza TaxID=226208 RepID=UPI0025AD6DD1|nr:uncharacterized protein LOC131009955 [Salvia miltiorrhiza]